MKNVLVLSYYFPPMGMGGVQRTAKFVKYLSDFGWNPTVITETPNVYFEWDYVLLEELNKRNIEIIRTGGDLLPHQTSGKKKFRLKSESSRKFLSRAAQTIMIPDTKMFWYRKAVATADKFIKANNIDIIFSTAPPYTDHIAGAALKKKHDIPLVLDYRDSWVDCPNNYYPTGAHRKLNIKLESRVLRSADKVITINNRIKELLTERYDEDINESNISVISQGYDHQDFLGINSDNYKTNKMRLTYSGSFLYYYTPEYFLKALALAGSKDPEILKNVEACFVGTFPENFTPLIGELGLKDNVRLTGYVSHDECIKYLLASDVLWMMINRTNASDMHSTGKLYEYFGAKKPILACVPDGEAKRSLENHGAAFICEPDDVNAIAKNIEILYSQYKEGNMPTPDNNFIRQYDRKYLTGKLSELFNSINT